MIPEHDKTPTEYIAVVGMAGRFPGANSVSALWENVKKGIESVKTFSDDELLQAGVKQSLLSNPRYVKARCFLENSELFDASFFGFTPREAECTDPQHRIFLECAWEALESAGYDPETYDGSIGVFAGCGMNHYLLKNFVANRRARNSMSERQTQICSDKDFLATRVSYKLNLKGPSLDIQTACSTSLVAIHIACQNLLDYQCDMALSGGAYIQIPRIGGFLYSDGDMRSPDGRCRTFDADANGTVFGEGAGVVVLKRLSDAVEDRDTILAVIRGTAINNDGAQKVGFTAPSVEGQAQVISMAHAMADVDPETITYIEAHGTGTALGDPIEIAALTKAFRNSTSKRNFCAVGSVKTNIGHLDAAAGATGLIKAVLALYHKQIPPSLNFERSKPELNLDTSPFYVNTKLGEWKQTDNPRRAGVSSFGVGGTNAHAIIEEAPSLQLPDVEQKWNLLTISARSEASLKKASENLLEYLEKNPGTNLSDAAFTLQLNRRHFEYRRTLICKDRNDAISALKNCNSDAIQSRRAVLQGNSLVFMFTGQGSQYVGMGQELYETEPKFHEMIDYCAQAIESNLGLDLRDLIFTRDSSQEDPTHMLTQTNMTQPALFIIEYALAKLWENLGLRPAAMIGHSIGEYVAACISGVFSLDDALKLVASRGALMQRQPGGSMLSVSLREDALKPYLIDGIDVSVINSPNATVVSGETEKIKIMEENLRKNRIACIRLRTSHAFHSKMMEPVLDEFIRAFDHIQLAKPTIPFISNITGDWITPAQATSPAYWASHIRQTVRFYDGVSKLLGEAYRIFIEVGPGRTLYSLVRQCAAIKNDKDGMSDVCVIQSLRHPKQQHSDWAFFLQSLGKVWIEGQKIDWHFLFKNEIRYRIPLPTTPFEQKKYWIEPDGDFHSNESEVHAKILEKSSTPSAPAADTKGIMDDSAQRVRGNIDNKTVQIITSIWQDLLGIDEIDADSNFFDLGGDSVWAGQVLSRISNQTGITLSLGDMFDNPTVGNLAQLLESQSANPEEMQELQVKRIDREKNIPLSQAQRRLWFLSRLEPESPAFNLALGLKIEGNLDTDVLIRVIETIVERHETLKTTFAEDNGNPKIVINNPDSLDLRIIDATKLEGGAKAAYKEIREACVLPFDLERGPLIRWYLLRIEPDAHVLVYNVHHIVFDGWSLGIFLKELGILYDAYSHSAKPSLPELEVQYVDCCVWHEEWLKRRNLTAQMDYWTKQLAGELPLLELPTDRPRSNHPDYSGRLEFIELSEDLSEQLKTLSKQEGVTLFMIFLAAFKIMLFRYTGQEDIIVGTPVANRNHIEMEKLIGFFINMLVLRSDLSGNPTFRELLARVKKTSLDAFTNQDLHFEQLVDILQLSRDMSHHPLYQAMFAFHNFAFPPVSLNDIRIENIMIDRGASQLDIWLSLWEEDDVFKGTVEYSSELFDHGTISRMIGHYLNILESMVADAHMRILNSSLLGQEEKEHIVSELNETQSQLPELCGLHQLFEEQANRIPEKTAILTDNKKLTYDELNKRSNQLAHFLIDLGVGPDTLIGLYVERSIDIVIGVLGILKAGGAYVPLDPAYPEERIAFMVEDACMPVILTQDDLETRLPENECVTVCLDVDWDEVAQESSDNPKQSSNRDNLAYVIYTSGSTGRPKGVQVPHGAVVNFLSSMSREPGVGEDDVLLAVTTLSFDIHVLEIFLPLFVGGTVVIASSETASDGERLLKRLNESQTTVMQATPSTWRLLLAAGWGGNEKFKVLCGGEAFPRDLAKELLSRVGSVWNMYGPTETTVWSSCYRITDGEDPILIGRPIANTQMYILDRLMHPVPIGVAGELHIGGDGVTRGYLNRPELTEKQFVPDPFRSDAGARLYKTGDLVRFRPDGNLEYLSRLDTQVKVRGFRIELGEIESVLSDHPLVDECVVTVREDQPGDVRLVGYNVVKAGMEMTASDLRTHLRTKLPDYMIPQHFVQLEELPLTPAGKVDRKNLPAPDSEGSLSSTDEYVAPRNETEETLASIWRDVIGVSRVGIHDNFFDIGGHSLLALRLISRINQAYQLKLPLRQLFDMPTILEFALSVENIVFGEVDSLTEEEAEQLLRAENQNRD